MSESNKPGASRSTSLVNRYAAGGPVLLYAVAGITPEHEQAHPGPGAWSLAEVTAHLLDTELVFADRMKRILAEGNPVLQGFDENLWHDALDYPSMPVHEAAELLAGNRRWMARLLASRPEADFARAGTHTEKGRQTLAEVLAYVTNHLDHHLRFIYGKRAGLGVALPPRYTSEAIGL